ncbi:MAG: DUF6596 domain-containing protein [Myxococcota bacterium]
MNDVGRQLERVARLSHGRLVGLLAARLGSIAAAEDALGDALVRALEVWPKTGLPENPEGWLATTARRRAIDRVRSDRLRSTYQRELEMVARTTEGSEPVTFDPRLNLMFACAHPAIDPSLRAPLMLQTVLGLDARRMASIYLVSPGTLGQRLTRAKAKIEANRIPFEKPDNEDEFATRLDDILNAIYAAYAVGYNGVGTGDAKASGLATEALWLVSTVCSAVKKSPEAHGLFSLLLFTEARRDARVDDSGELVPLQEQATDRWDAAMLRDAAEALTQAQRNLTLGRFQLEAAIQAVHCARRETGHTDWNELRVLYRGLANVCPTVGVLSGLAAVEAEAIGPAAGLAILDQVDPKLRASYQPWYATRAHLLATLERHHEAAKAYDQAIGLSDDPAARKFLLARRQNLREG